MQPPGQTRPALVRSLDRALVAVGAAGIVLGLLEMAVLPLDGPVGGVLLALPLVFWTYLAAGLIAWHRRPSNPFGALVLWVGFTVFLAGVANTEIPALVAVGAVTGTLALAAMVHLLLAFPSGHLRTRPARIVVASAYVVSLVLAAPGYLLDPAGPFSAFAVADLPGVAAGATVLESGGGLLVVVATIAILVTRLRSADRRHRRLLVPLLSYGILAMLFIPFSSLVLGGMTGMDPALWGGLQFLAIGILPVAFVYGILRGDFARTGELLELGTWLGSAQSGRDTVRAALARTLGDPSLTLWFRSDERDGYVDHSGATRTDAEAAGTATRGWQEIHLEDRTIGAIDYDNALITDPALVRTAGNVVAIAVERERLTAELLTSRRELLDSRERIIVAADRERHRIARDLHDGLQVQLVLLALEAQRLAKSVDVDTGADHAGADDHRAAVRDGATRLRRQLDDASRQLRTLVHDLVPAALIERGLDAAVEDLTDRMPLPARLDSDLPGERLPRIVESTAYLVVAESLTNVVKHAGATTVTVRLRRDESCLHIRVSDDGTGGARTEDGWGIRGLRDRVETLRGRFDLVSDAGEGTTLTVELPCES